MVLADSLRFVFESVGGLYGFIAGAPVEYDDTIRLIHMRTGRALHSHATNYSHPGSSGQQQVTAFQGSDNNDYWVVMGPHGQPNEHKSGKPIQNKEIVRLKHLGTQRNLHSHRGVHSPLSGQQEVTAFGNAGVGDDNDNWRVEILLGNAWRRRLWVRLVHVNTNCALHSHKDHEHDTYTSGQQEVTCFGDRDDNDWWCVDA